MCGRFTQGKPGEVLEAVFGARGDASRPPRYNIAPSQQVLIVRAAPSDDRAREFARAGWGLVPAWAKDPRIGSRLINARAETLARRPAFRAALESRRCLVPADGFYEWKGLGRGRQPYYVRFRSGAPFAFAGLWERWRDPTGARRDTCAIVTCPANGLLAPIHDRMPVILPPEAYATWLGEAPAPPEGLLALLGPCPPEEMEAYPVSHAVNDPRRDAADLIAPLAEAS